MGGQTGERLTLPDEDLVAEEELRLAVVLNGGVSLAIWMGGVALEIQRLTEREGVYGRLLRALSTRARADIIAGTSAGGINGGALAVGQVYPEVKMDKLRDVWAEQGSLLDLLHEPWDADTASLLKGDDRFLPGLRAAFAELLAPAALPGASAYSAEDRPVHLTLTTTLLIAREDTVTDSLGEQVSQPNHAGMFSFVRLPNMLVPVDDFAPPVGNLADRLALASRASASFPLAFEPVHVRSEPTESSADSPTGEPAGPAPNMYAHANFKVSRWVVDGGMLMNTPLRPVLEAIQAAPAAIQIRRALLLVVPDPYRASPEEKAPDKAKERPSTLKTLGHIVQSVESQTVAEELRLIQEHNMRAQARRDARTDMLRTIAHRGPDISAELAELADALFANYRDIRIWRAARNIGAVAAPILGEPADRLAHDIRVALRGWTTRSQRLPWVPDTFADGVQGALAATEADPQASNTVGSWEWGLAALERLSVAVHDLLKRAIWVLPPTSGQRDVITALRIEQSEIRSQLMSWRNADTDYWIARAKGVRSAQPTGRVDPTALGEAFRAGLEEWPARLGEFVKAPVAPTRAEKPTLLPLGTIAKALLDIGQTAAAVLPREMADADPLLQASRLLVLRRVFDPEPPNAPDTGPGAPLTELERRMRAALGLEVCYLCLVETDEGTASEQAIDLVRISAGVRQPFAPTLAAEDRVSGLRLVHFAAFLKQAWRVNDWMWGRLDAANRLVWLLLDPPRLRRRVLLSSAEDQAVPAAAGAAGSPAARRILATILGLEPGEEPGKEWTDLLKLLDGNPDTPLARGRELLEPLADQLIREIAEEIVAFEEGALKAAVEADEKNGENPLSAGSRWKDRRFPTGAAATSGTRKEAPT